MIKTIKDYEKIKFSWDESIKELGVMKPSSNGHTSIFLYPYNYFFTKNIKSIIKSLENKGWIYHKNNLDDFHKVSKLTDYVGESLFNENYIFSKKINKEFEIWVDGVKKSICNISKIEAIFFENNIIIFSLFTSSSDTIQNISSVLNRELRNSSCLYFDQRNSRILSFDNTKANIENLKQEYIDKGNDFISFDTYIFSLVESDKTIDLKELKSGKSKYAKFITAIHADINKDLESNILYTYPELQHETDVAMNVLQICSNNLCTANDFIISDRKFEQDLDYVRANIKNHGIRLWSLWSGMASLNSLGFLSINDGSGSIIYQCNNEIYLIFLIDFYIKLRLQHLDKLIIDESFMQQTKSRENLENLFMLKSKYFSDEVADSFQPVIIDKKIKAALGIDSLMKNIEENIVKTNEIIKDNNSTVIAIIGSLYVFLNGFIPLFIDSVFVKNIIIVLIELTAFLVWKKRYFLGKMVEKVLKKFKII